MATLLSLAARVWWRGLLEFSPGLEIVVMASLFVRLAH